jgi:hypothetical protein
VVIDLVVIGGTCILRPSLPTADRLVARLVDWALCLVAGAVFAGVVDVVAVVDLCYSYSYYC